MKPHLLLWKWALGWALLATPAALAQPGPRAKTLALLAASEASHTTDTAASRRSAQQAWQVAAAAGLDTLAVRAHVQLGLSAAESPTRTDWTLAHLWAARASATALNLPDAVALTYRGEGFVDEHRKQFAAARTAFEHELALWQQLGNEKNISGTHNNLGRTYREEGRYPEAMRAYLTGLRRAERSANVSGQLTSLRNLGSLSALVNDPAAAEYLRRALGLLRKQARPDTLVLLSVYSSLSIALLEKERYAKAQPYLLAGLALARRVKVSRIRDHLGYLEYGLAEVYNIQKNYYAALRHYRKAAVVFGGNGFGPQQVSALYGLAEVQQQLGQTSAALQSAQEALALGGKSASVHNRASTFSDFAEFSTSRRDYATAYTYHLRGQALKDSIFTADQAEQMGELRARYETEQQETQLRLLRGEAVLQRAEAGWQRRYRNLLAGALVVVGLLGAASYRRYRMQRRTSRLLRQAQQQELARNAELEQVQQQLRRSLDDKEVLLKEVHHRVKNNLQIVSSLLALQVQAQAQLPVVAAALREGQNWVKSIALTHELLYQADDLARVDFQQFASQLAAHLQRAFAVPTVRVQVQAAGVHLGTDTAVPLGLIVNELLSNAFKYACANGRGGQLVVALRCDPAAGLFRLTVADDGPGLPPGFTLAQASSLGLRLVQSLARQLGGELTLPPAGEATFEVTFPGDDPAAPCPG